jgi:amino-acid N-acetyltransferase
MPSKKAAGKALSIRKAVIADVPEIQALVNRFANERKMLSRSLSEIYENVRDFFVIEDKGAVVGSAALHVFWGDLAEVRALAVASGYQGQGLGRRLITACRNDARRMGIKKIFALTFQQDFFHKVGFTDITKDELPHKVWSDCIKCPMFPNCDEIAVILELDGVADSSVAAAPAAKSTSKPAGRRK